MVMALRLGVKQQAFMARHRPPDLLDRNHSALESHAPAPMGKAGIPGHKIVRTTVAVDTGCRHLSLHFHDHQRGVVLEIERK
jgi:hypothetical protein